MSQSIIGCVNKPPHTYLYIKYPVGAFFFLSYMANFTSILPL